MVLYMVINRKTVPQVVSKEPSGETIKEATMKIESPAFSHNQNIPPKYTCDGENINPPLKISNIQQGVKSIVLIVDDPDAPMGTWVHWTLWNISPDVTEIVENSVPKGAVEGTTSYDKPGYGGPCPPSGTHRYLFKLYALDTELDLPINTDKDALEQAIQGHLVDSTEFIGLYSKE